MQKKPNGSNENEKLIRIDEVLKLIPVSKSTIGRMRKEPEFPKSVPISKRTVGWKESEIIAWINSRKGLE